MSPITCPTCNRTWTTQTSTSWWLWYDRCVACLQNAVGGDCLDPESPRLPTEDEASAFRVGQLDLGLEGVAP